MMPTEPTNHSWAGIPFRTLTAEARAVLELFGMGGAAMGRPRTSENCVWRISHGGAIYALRCHRPPVLALASLPTLQANEIAAELEWLCMLAGQVSFPIPAPVAARDGASVVTRRLDQGTSLHWTMLRWVPGRQYRRGIRDIHLERAGEMTAELHAITRRMECPVLPRPRWDARQLHAAVEELRPHFAAGALPPHIWDLVLEAERGCVALMAQPSTASQFGLIHADLGVQNFVFRGGQVSPIDFCSCGYGYFAFDIAQILLPAPRQSYWEAFLRAYARAGGSGVDEAAVRQFSGMSFILWLNFNIPTRFRGIEMRLESRALRMRELLPR